MTRAGSQRTYTLSTHLNRFGKNHRYRRVVLRWLFATVIAAILSTFAVLLLTGEYLNDGPVLVSLGEDRGIHTGDIFIATGWAAALLSEVGLLLTARPRRQD